MNSKIETYIGFAIKKGAVAFGIDSIERCRKKVYLLLATETLSENSLKVAQKCAQKFGCPLQQIEDYSVLAQRNCKAIAICDKSLADAILNVCMLGGKNG